jgi:hypothetical protein
VNDEQKAQLAKWVGDTGMVATCISTIALLWKMLGRKRHPTMYPTGRGRLTPPWNRCCTAGCEERVRPIEFLCAKHWIRVPVAVRMLVRKLQTKTFPQSRMWVIAACRAVIFVRNEIEWDTEMRLDALEGT